MAPHDHEKMSDTGVSSPLPLCLGVSLDLRRLCAKIDVSAKGKGWKTAWTVEVGPGAGPPRPEENETLRQAVSDYVEAIQPPQPPRAPKGVAVRSRKRRVGPEGPGWSRREDDGAGSEM